MISGNPLLGAYVTELVVKLGVEDGSEEKMNLIYAEIDDDYFDGVQDANTIIKYMLYPDDT